MTIRRWQPQWILLAIALCAIALLVTPELVASRMPPKAETFKELLFAGIRWMRMLSVLAAGLALISAWHWRGGLTEGEDQNLEAGVSNKSYLVVMALLAGIGFVLRLPGINTSLRMDELNTVVRIVNRGLAVIAAFSADGNNHLMNSLLIYVSTHVLGEREWAIRLPNLILGTAGGPVAYILLRKIVPAPAAVLSGLLVAVHFRNVTYSGEARGYAGAVLFAAVASCLFVLLSQRFSVKRALAYAASAALTNGFLATSLYVPAVHGVIAAAMLLQARRRRANRKTIRQRANVLLTCGWAGLISIFVNVLTLPQLLVYARERGSLAHIKMGPELAAGTLRYVMGVEHGGIALVLIAASVAGWLLSREKGILFAAIAGPPLGYIVAFSATGMRGSPRLFALLIFPVMVGLAMLAEFLWRQPRLGWVGAVALLAIFVGDALPEFRPYYQVGTPGLREVAGQLRGEDVMLAGEQADMNVYYFPAARVSLAPQWREALREIEAANPAPKYLLIGIECRTNGAEGVDRAGYRQVEYLRDWSFAEPARGERHPCFVLYGR